MSDIAIKVEGLGKRYRIGAQQERYPTIREAFVSGFKRMTTKRVNHPDTNTIWALKDVSFEVKHGEVMGIIGRNGAGKSTLLKVLSHITEPTEGKVHLHGRVGSLLEVGTGFHPELTGRENIYLNGAILGMKKTEIDRKFDEIVAFSEIEKFLDTPVKHYSSGMYVRLAFAVAAHMEPEILVVDEVLAVGDAAFQKKCMGKMGDVAKNGRTVLFVSHNMPAIRNLCSRVLLLEQGKIKQIGQTEGMIDQYLLDSVKENSESVDMPKSSADAPGRAIRLFFSNSDGTPKSCFRLGEPWRSCLEFEIVKPLPHVIAAVGLQTTEMTPIITYWSKPQDLAPGTYRVEFEVEERLASYNIQFEVGLSTEGRPFYVARNIGLVRITDVALGEQPVSASIGLLSSNRRSEIRSMKEGSSETINGVTNVQ